MCNQGTWEGHKWWRWFRNESSLSLIIFCGGIIYQCLERKALYTIVKLFSKIYAQK